MMMIFCLSKILIFVSSSIQSLYEISPAGISEAFHDKYGKKSKISDTITLDDFLIMAAKPFIDSVCLKNFTKYLLSYDDEYKFNSL